MDGKGVKSRDEKGSKKAGISGKNGNSKAGEGKGAVAANGITVRIRH